LLERLARISLDFSRLILSVVMLLIFLHMYFGGYMTPFWKPMPYYALREKEVLKLFKSNNVSSSIAAIKIDILICLTSDLDENGKYCTSLTYDQLTKYASLS
ncbi:UNVERIFIED_CONTAM: hypothetical protein ITH96_25095, partial [Salmonella enterica subsp. enterica serovar Weltevreden]